MGDGAVSSHDSGGEWGDLRPVREAVRDFSRGGSTSDYARLRNMERAVGVPLFTLCPSLDSPFPDALFE